MMAKHSYKMFLPRKYITLEPTDSFLMPSKNDAAYNDQYYCTELHIGANGLLEVHAVDHYYQDPNLKPSDQVVTDLDNNTNGSTSLAQTSATLAFMMDIPLLYDTDKDSPGFYVMLTGAANKWQGGGLYVDAASPSVATAFGLAMITPTSGSAWELVASSTFNVPQGIAINKLAPNMHGCYWDRETVLTVKVINGMDLVSAAEDDMLVQPLNATVIGNGPIYDSGGNIVGRTPWEVVQYANVLDKGNGVFEVSNFLRGLRGTERAINGHVNGESFVRLTDSLSRVLTTQAELNVPDTYRTMSTNTDSSGAQNIPAFADTGNSLKPYTVKVHSTLRDVDGDVTVSWWPRVRQNGQWLSGSEVAIAANDTPETYQVDVCTAAHPKTAVVTYTLTGQTLTRTLVSNGVTTSMPAPATPVGLGASFVYTAAMQAADLGSAQAKAYLAIYMISTIVGRGFGKGVAV
jgi:hypothetical protein